MYQFAVHNPEINKDNYILLTATHSYLLEQFRKVRTIEAAPTYTVPTSDARTNLHHRELSCIRPNSVSMRHSRKNHSLYNDKYFQRCLFGSIDAYFIKNVPHCEDNDNCYRHHLRTRYTQYRISSTTSAFAT